jgi:cytidine deaminase
LFQQNVLAYLAAISVALVWMLLYRTTWGLRVRATGEHPEASDTVGISVRGIRWSAVLAGGVFGGLGGSFFTLASTGSFSKEFTVGNGFIALAAVIMGRWHPVLAAIMCLFFGFVTQMASQLQTLSTPMPSQFLLILPYVATIIAVAGLVGRVRPPAADGIPFEVSTVQDEFGDGLTGRPRPPRAKSAHGPRAILGFWWCRRPCRRRPIVTGCNVENASYGLTLCAECGLISALHASGGGRLLAFACVDRQGSVLMPCGRCRQLLWEHGGPGCVVDTPAGIQTMAELLPQAFGAGDLHARSRC